MGELSFDGKVAIITGSGGGLGRCHALELARRGARVVVNDLGGARDGGGPPQASAESVVAEIEAAGGEAVPNADSVATPEGGAAIVKAALDAFGRLDILVNNAGILRDAPFAHQTPGIVDPVIDVHLRGAFHVTRPAWEIFREQRYGRIIITTSDAGLFGNFGFAGYGAAKMGLVGLTRVLAIEGAKRNIITNAIAPIARTRMTETLMDDEWAEYVPELVSPLVTYLAHESCGVNGHLYTVGAGKVQRVFIATTPGIADRRLTAEKIAASMHDIDDVSGFEVR